MYLNGTLVILTVCKMKVCLGVASQHKYLQLLCVPVVSRTVCQPVIVLASVLLKTLRCA